MNTETDFYSEILTVRDIAEEYNVNRSTVGRWINWYGLKATIIGKNTYTIKRSDLEHFLATNKVIKTKKSQPETG